ncbi:MAG: Crp/Fnr family transcriptional regulator [Herminiimonas sp.]|nr:Crp/Fnr family transcriptional regulator [Herminiimonas sp.]
MVPAVPAVDGTVPGSTQKVGIKLEIKQVQISQVNIQVHLRKIPLLASLSDEEVLKIKGEFRFRRYDRRDTVLQKGGDGDNLLFLLSGQMQVIDVTEDGRAIGLRMLQAGDFFGEIAVINGSTRSATVVALTEVLVGFLPRAVALDLFANSPSVANLMLRHLAQKVERDSHLRALLSIQNAPRRIYAFIDLLKQASADGTHVVENLPTHQDIAIMINTSRETVTRTLVVLIQQGIAVKDGHRLLIVDNNAMQKLIQGVPQPVQIAVTGPKPDA